MPDSVTVLVIDDEAIIRQLIRRALEPERCRVVEAESGQAGLRILEQGIPPIDVVLTDVKMLGLSGLDVVEVLARYRPQVPVGVISGSTATAQVQELGAWFLAKPFTPSDLAKFVSSLVAEARARQARVEGHHAPPGSAQEDDAAMLQQHASERAHLDLAAAAWNLHYRLHRE